MKYIFDIDDSNNKFIVKVTVQEGNSGMNSQVQTMSTNASENPEWEMECPQVLKLLLDNLRFSVKERAEAEHNLSVFLSYLYGNLMKAIENTPKPEEQMIVENDDSDVDPEDKNIQ